MSFYVSIERMYERALKLIVKKNLMDIFRKCCLDIINKTERVGWGFHDSLTKIYSEYSGK